MDKHISAINENETNHEPLADDLQRLYQKNLQWDPEVGEFVGKKNLDRFAAIFTGRDFAMFEARYQKTFIEKHQEQQEHSANELYLEFLAEDYTLKLENQLLEIATDIVRHISPLIILAIRRNAGGHAVQEGKDLWSIIEKTMPVMNRNMGKQDFLSIFLPHFSIKFMNYFLEKIVMTMSVDLHQKKYTGAERSMVLSKAFPDFNLDTKIWNHNETINIMVLLFSKFKQGRIFVSQNQKAFDTVPKNLKLSPKQLTAAIQQSKKQFIASYIPQPNHIHSAENDYFTVDILNAHTLEIKNEICRNLTVIVKKKNAKSEISLDLNLVKDDTADKVYFDPEVGTELVVNLNTITGELHFFHSSVKLHEVLPEKAIEVLTLLSLKACLEPDQIQLVDEEKGVSPFLDSGVGEGLNSTRQEMRSILA